MESARSDGAGILGRTPTQKTLGQGGRGASGFAPAGVLVRSCSTPTLARRWGLCFECAPKRDRSNGHAAFAAWRHQRRRAAWCCALRPPRLAGLLRRYRLRSILRHATVVGVRHCYERPRYHGVLAVKALSRMNGGPGRACGHVHPINCTMTLTAALRHGACALGNVASRLGALMNLKIDSVAVKAAIRTAGALMLGNAFVAPLLLDNRNWIGITALVLVGFGAILITSFKGE